MVGPQPPALPEKGAARAAQRGAPGLQGGHVPGLAPVPRRADTSLRETVTSLVYVQPDEPDDHTVGTLWYDTDEVCT